MAEAKSSYWTALRFRLRPITDQRAAVWATIVTLFSMLRPGRRELWIGDSHAAALVSGPSWAMFLVGRRGEIVLRLGARLMYSLARDGFPPRARHLLGALGRLGRRDSFVPVFVAGEIDVRNALPAHPGTQLGFVERYVDRARSLADDLRATRAWVVVPPPPCPRERIDAQYPTVGTDQERLEAFHALRSALVRATEGRSDVGLIDLTGVLAGADGMMLPHLTDDGCHTNATAHPLIRDLVDARLAAAAARV